jgi:hypothetical protein
MGPSRQYRQSDSWKKFSWESLQNFPMGLLPVYFTVLPEATFTEPPASEVPPANQLPPDNRRRPRRTPGPWTPPSMRIPGEGEKDSGVNVKSVPG